MPTTYIWFEPIEWIQEIRDDPSINVRGRYLRANCRVAANCHVFIDGKIDLREFTSIPISILDGAPPEEEMPEAPKNKKTLGELSYMRDQNYPNGWFYLENSEWFTAVWDQVREGGYSDCRIAVGAGPVESSGVEDWIWNADRPLHIDSAELQFNRKTNPVVLELRHVQALLKPRIWPGIAVIAVGVLIALWIAKLWR